MAESDSIVDHHENITKDIDTETELDEINEYHAELRKELTEVEDKNEKWSTPYLIDRIQILRSRLGINLFDPEPVLRNQLAELEFSYHLQPTDFKARRMEILRKRLGL